MIHSFDTIVAKKVGINSAVILNNLYFWIEKNKANETNYYDGYYWTYNSKKAFGELFPYFTTRQIDYAIKKLIDDGYVITGNYNKIAPDSKPDINNNIINNEKNHPNDFEQGGIKQGFGGSVLEVNI